MNRPCRKKNGSCNSLSCDVIVSDKHCSCICYGRLISLSLSLTNKPDGFQVRGMFSCRSTQPALKLLADMRKTRVMPNVLDSQVVGLDGILLLKCMVDGGHRVILTFLFFFAPSPVINHYPPFMIRHIYLLVKTTKTEVSTTRHPPFPKADL